MAELAPKLKFVANPALWGTYLQGGIRQVEEGDYTAITSGSPISAETPFRTTEELAAQSLFALEAHLEEFIPELVEDLPGRSIGTRSQGEQTGRQYPAATWSIDFLAVDQNTNELVVIELKRGQTSDASVGQVLRYINWIKKNLAKPDQNVRGIIVASEIDDALRYAVTGLPNIQLNTHAVLSGCQSVVRKGRISWTPADCKRGAISVCVWASRVSRPAVRFLPFDE